MLRPHVFLNAPRSLYYSFFFFFTSLSPPFCLHTVETCEFTGDDATRAEVGDGIAYSFTIKNTGSTTLLDIDVTSRLKEQAPVSAKSARLDSPNLTALHLKLKPIFPRAAVFFERTTL